MDAPDLLICIMPYGDREYREPTISEVVAWLREQDAIDYEAAARARYPNELRPNVGQVEMARRIVDAALSVKEEG